MTPPGRPRGGVTRAVCQAESMWAVGEDMDGMWNIVGGERGS